MQIFFSNYSLQSSMVPTSDENDGTNSGSKLGNPKAGNPVAKALRNPLTALKRTALKSVTCAIPLKASLNEIFS